MVGVEIQYLIHLLASIPKNRPNLFRSANPASLCTKAVEGEKLIGQVIENHGLRNFLEELKVAARNLQFWLPY